MSRARLALLAGALLGCAGAAPAVAPACSDDAYGLLTGECAAAAARCAAQGGSVEACGVICDAEADAWRERCQ